MATTVQYVQNQYYIDKIRSVTQFNLTDGMVDWTITDVTNAQIEFTGESVDKVDAEGVLIARIDKSKGFTFSGEGSMINMRLLASQRGGTVDVASEDAPIEGQTFERVKVVTETDDDGNTTKTATLKYTPSETPLYVYPLTEDKDADRENAIEIGTDDGQASLSDNVLTLPDDFEGTQIGILYTYTVTAGVQFIDKSEEFASAAGYIVEFYGSDVCNPGAKRCGTIIAPKAKIDNNFTLSLDTEGTHPFSFSALKDYCSDDAELVHIIWTEE